jgi:hypothetical protein
MAIAARDQQLRAIIREFSYGAVVAIGYEDLRFADGNAARAT